MIDLTIVIVSFNTHDLIRDCLSSLDVGCDGVTVETMVVDNASTDGSSEMIRGEFPQVRLLANHLNMGFAAANNVALRLAKGRYVVLLNPDTRVHPGALSKLASFMDRTPSAGYCGPRLVNEDGSHQPSARRFPTILSAAYALVGLTRRFPRSRHTLNLHSIQGDTECFRADWLCGACLMVRSDCIRQTGFLDQGFFLYFEETDWCRKMAREAWEGWYVGSAEVVHLGGQSIAHNDNVRPFSGDHPVHWVKSSRRYMRRYYGWSGMVVSELLQIALYVLIWLRHCWRRSLTSRVKTRTAAAAIRYLVT